MGKRQQEQVGQKPGSPLARRRDWALVRAGVVRDGAVQDGAVLTMPSPNCMGISVRTFVRTAGHGPLTQSRFLQSPLTEPSMGQHCGRYTQQPF